MRICGLDEVGRGALAGPLVACGVVWPSSKLKISKLMLKDSKRLTKKQREQLYADLLSCGIRAEIEVISARQINSHGIGWANIEIFRRLIKKIDADKYLIDGDLKIRVRGKNTKIKSIIDADASRKCVMAASIIAKVTRDKLMTELHEECPDYGWNKNYGYGTTEHIERIYKYGEVFQHRSVYVTTVMKKYPD